MKLHYLLILVLLVFTSTNALAASEVSIGGVVEIETGGEDNNITGDDSSDNVLATVELGVDAKLNDFASARVLLLWEEDDTDPLDMDEGVITLSSPYGLTLTAGKMYIPFGNFDSSFISDPLTLELGETNKSALIFSYGNDFFELSAGGFNGDHDKIGDDNIDDVVASLTITPNENITFGVSYISDLAESDFDLTTGTRGTWDAFLGTTLMDITPLTKNTAGLAGFISITAGPITISAEHIEAEGSFDPADLNSDASTGTKEDPTTYNYELAVALNDSVTVALKREGSDDFVAFDVEDGYTLDMPDKQVGVAVSLNLFEGVGLAFEYLDGTFNDPGPTGKDDRQLYTAQLALEF